MLLQDKLREAARSQLNRMTAAKKKRKSMEAAEWIKQEWGKNKGMMIEMLLENNFDKETQHHKVTNKVVSSELQM